MTSPPDLIDNKEMFHVPYKIKGTGRVTFLLLWAYARRDRVLIKYIEPVPEGTGSLKMVLPQNA